MCRTSSLTVLSFLCLGALAGCGGNTRDRDPGIQFDASLDAVTPPPAAPDGSRPDAGGPGTDADAPDAPAPPPPPVMGAVGSPCTSDADCPDGTCVTESDGFFGGYCVVLGCDAADGTGCPDGSSCIEVGGGETACFAICEPDAAMPCRRGYACAAGLGIPEPICLPGCTSDADCPDGRSCDPTGGDNGVCIDPNAAAGDACVDESECPAGSFCLSEPFTGNPGGACAVLDCDPVSGRGCADGAACVQFETRRGPIAYCLAACELDAAGACRPGYRCDTNVTTGRTYCAAACTSDADCSDGRVCNPGTGLCGPEFDTDQLGGMCTGRSGCVGGSCLREVDTGYPGAYCAYAGCDATMPDAMDGCPSNGVCALIGTRPFCHEACVLDGDCRAGYACRDVDAARPDRGKACLPACTADSQCANMGFVCRADGFCAQPFDPTNQGEPCDGAATCPGGTCYTEARDGYPSGLCTAACPLMTTDGSGCPMGSVCADDMAGPAETGFCLDTCDPASASSCRPGYACHTEGDVAVCRPACTSDADCDSTRRCALDSGRCVAR